MLKRFLFALLLCAAWYRGFAATTTITGPVNTPFGATFTGKITVNGPAMTTAAGVAVAPSQRTYTVTNGAFATPSPTLEPNDTATPAGTSYSVTYNGSSMSSTFTERWVVTTSVTALTVAAVRVTTTPVPTVTVNLSQLYVLGQAKGDLIAYGTAWGRLAVGTDGKVLTADSTASKGVSWQTPATSIPGNTPYTGTFTGTGGITILASTHTQGVHPLLQGFDSTGSATALPYNCKTSGGATVGCADATSNGDLVIGTVTSSTYTYQIIGSGSGVQGATGATGTTGSAGANGTNGAIAQIQDEGSNVTVRPTLNFTGALAACTDNSGQTRTDCDFSLPSTVVRTNQSNTFSTGTQDASAAAHTLPEKVGTVASLPATCTLGEKYFASNATAGQNEYYCTATNTWTQQTGGSGSLPSMSGHADEALTNDGVSTASWRAQPYWHSFVIGNCGGATSGGGIGATKSYNVSTTTNAPPASFDCGSASSAVANFLTVAMNTGATSEIFYNTVVPSNYVAGSAINVKLKWLAASAVSSETIITDVATTCVVDGGTSPTGVYQATSYNAATAVTVNPNATAFGAQKTSYASVAMTNCVAGASMTLRVRRTGGTSSGAYILWAGTIGFATSLVAVN